MFVQASEECFHEPFSNIIYTVIVFTVTWEVTSYFIVVDEAIFVTDWFYLCVLDSRQGVNGVGKSTDTEAHVGTKVSWQEGHLYCFVVVLVCHEVDDVHSIHIGVCQPVKGNFKVLDNSIVFKDFRCIWFYAVKYFVVFVNVVVTAVPAWKETLQDIDTGTEVLDVVAFVFTFRIQWRYTTWDTRHFTVTVFSHGCHTFVLDRRVLVAHRHTVATEGVRKFVRPEDCQVWFWRVTDVVKCIQEAVVHLGHTVTAIVTHTCHRCCQESRVTRVDFVEGFCTSKFNCTEFQDEVIYKLLDFWLSEGTTSQVTFCVDVQDDWHTTKWSCSTVDHTADCHEGDVDPLDSFFGVQGWTANINPIVVTQAYHLLKSLVLQVDFFAKTDGFFVDCDNGIPVFHFFFHQVVGSIKGKTSVHTDDTTTWISIWKTRNVVGVTSATDVWSVSTEDTVVYSCRMFSIDFMEKRIWSVSIFDQSCLSHTDTTARHEVQFEELIVLDTKNQFILLIDVTSWDISDGCRTVDIHRETSVFIMSFCFFNNLFDFQRTLSCTSQEAFITIIRCVVCLYKAGHARFFLPVRTSKTFPSLGENVFSNIFCFNFCWHEISPY